uniref:Uncharacterized protein n=1 Tax=Glossina austeni TaxID=7395 RepID=A0A1A9UKX1_GLOAU
MELVGVNMKKPEDVTIEREFEKIKKLDIENWENIRGPRPWEENNKYCYGYKYCKNHCNSTVPLNVPHIAGPSTTIIVTALTRPTRLPRCSPLSCRIQGNHKDADLLSTQLPANLFDICDIN